MAAGRWVWARSRRTKWALLGMPLLLLAGCGNLSGFQYVSHTDQSGADMYFQLPTGWKTFSQSQMIQAANGRRLSSSQIAQLEGSNFVETFVGSQRATLKEAGKINGSSPSGIIEAHPLSSSEQDSMSLAALRTQLLPSDPLNPPNPSPYVVLNYSTFTRAGGLRGSNMTVDIRSSSGAISTFHQIAMVDSATNYLYLIAVSCQASCYNADQSLINQVITSWNVHEG